jgi:hypothetical protein
VLKNGVGRFNIFFFIFTQILLNPPVSFSRRIHQYFLFITCVFFSKQFYHTYLTWNEGNMPLFDFLMSRKEFNVYQHDIHIFMNMIIWPLITYKGIHQIMDLKILFFTVILVYRIIHVTAMSQDRDDYRKKELILKKLCFIMF